MMNRKERRFSYSPTQSKEYRAQITGGDGSRHIRGYGIVFNQNSKIITEWVNEKEEFRTFYETILPTALDDILNNDFDVVLDINHMTDEILARIASGTLTLTKDEKGIIYDCDAPDTARGEDALQMVQRGDYYESSFCFGIAEDGDEWVLDKETGIYTRTISKIETLFDVAICTYRGAYDNTSIENVKEDKERVHEYNKEDLEVVSRKLDDLHSKEVEVKEEETKEMKTKRKFDNDFITKIYLKRNWNRKKSKAMNI